MNVVQRDSMSHSLAGRQPAADKHQPLTVSRSAAADNSTLPPTQTLVSSLITDSHCLFVLSVFPWNVIFYHSVPWHCWLGDGKGIHPVKTGCWFVDGNDLTEVLHAPVFSTTSIILSCNKVQNGDVLVPANPDPSGKWPFKRRERSSPAL